MSFDLALNRITHDLEWQVIPLPAPEAATEWDNDATEWDDEDSIETIWDPPLPPPQKYEIWPINGADKVAQQIKINLLSFLGEWFLDNTYGVPYLEDILVKNPRMSAVETIFRSHINSVPNVIRITSFSMDWNRRERTLRIDFACDTDLGPIQDSVKLEMLQRV